MENNASPILIETSVNILVEKAWEYWTDPAHITKWNSASDEWHTPKASNDLRVGGKFTARMEAKDGSMGFDFEGVYDTVSPFKQLAYTLEDGRKVSVELIPSGNVVLIKESFDPETANPVDLQRSGWQVILDNFKKYAESL